MKSSRKINNMQHFHIDASVNAGRMRQKSNSIKIATLHRRLRQAVEQRY